MSSAVGNLVMMISVGACLGQTMHDTQNILNHILTDYNPDIRPAYNQSLPVEVNVSMELVRIKEFDDVSGRVTLVVIMNMDWSDSRLTWNPLKYNNTLIITLPARKIWKPNLLLTSPVDENRPVGGEQDWAVIKCTYDGRIFWVPADTITSSCDVDVRNFPFDTQTCKQSFVPWGFSANEISLTATEDKVFFTFYTENGAWTVADSILETENAGQHFSILSVTLILDRRPTFFLVNAVLPVILISLMNVLVFFIPAECGERVSYAITVYLALAVFMTIVGDNLPKHSKEMAVICYFLLINVAHSTLICFENIVCLLTYYRQGPVPLWLGRIFSGRTSKTTRTNTKAEKTSTVYDNGNQFEENGCFQTITSTSWRDISRSLDKIFGVVSTCLILIFAVSFMCSIGVH